MIELAPVSGTRDFFPDEMRYRNWLFGHFREVARLCGFEEYDAPVLEHEELYKRKAGEEITQQMYNFVTRGGEAVSLRPEMTPTLARMVLAKGRALRLPAKWFSVPQCWRYENTTRGRKREHYQWNCDIVGAQGVAAEAELLSAVTTFFQRMGLTSKDVGIRVNSRRVMGSVMAALGVGDDLFAPVCVIVDKLDKIGAEGVKKELTEAAGIDGGVADAIIATMSARSLGELKSACAGVDPAAVEEMETLFALAEGYGYADYLAFDASVVRGLAYYTGVVFECFDRQGELRAIAGGGRYDRLLSLYGAPTPVPACGFGFGDCVIMELLKDKKLLPDLSHEVDYVVASYNADMQAPALRVASELRGLGASVDVLMEPKRRVAGVFDYADRVGARRLIFVAPDEHAKGMVRVKDLRVIEGEGVKQVDVPLDSLAEVDQAFGARPGGRPLGGTGATSGDAAVDAAAAGGAVGLGGASTDALLKELRARGLVLP